MATIRDVLVAQQREREAHLAASYVERDHGVPGLEHDLINVVLGPRRAGKSFFAIHLVLPGSRAAVREHRRDRAAQASPVARDRALLLEGDAQRGGRFRGQAGAGYRAADPGVRRRVQPEDEAARDQGASQGCKRAALQNGTGEQHHTLRDQQPGATSPTLPIWAMVIVVPGATSNGCDLARIRERKDGTIR
jgi:hypothetical protein